MPLTEKPDKCPCCGGVWTQSYESPNDQHYISHPNCLDDYEAHKIILKNFGGP